MIFSLTATSSFDFSCILSEDAIGLWRMFDPTFEGKVELVPCGEREGFNLEIVGNFRVPDRAALSAPLPQGKGNLRTMGKFEVKIVPTKHAERKQVKKPAQGLGKEKPEDSVAPPLVSQEAGISRSCYRRYTDYVVVSDTLEGLGALGSGAAVSGTSAGSGPAGEKKRN
ncbi:hypothetical protein Hanom_Chr15g01359751 [Helianthus anomalus]